MAISFAQVNTAPHASVIGDRVLVTVDVTLDSSYPTGGYAVSPSTFGLTLFDEVSVQLAPATGGVLFAYNYSTGKLQAFANTGAETASTTDLHTCTGRARFVGKGFATFANV